MAYIGLRKPIMAARKGYRDYETPFAFGKAIGLTVTPEYMQKVLFMRMMHSLNMTKNLQVRM